jgi:hypothetical protein
MPDKSLFDVAYPEALRNIETGLFKKRPKWKEADPTQQAVGIAISGGGIRSATFSLGVFQALAKLKLLRHIDYVSSVSGGGYFAGLYGRIFTREDVHNVGEVEDILSPDRAGQSLDPGPDNWRDGLFRWIRENGRYLAPKGGGDLLLALAVMFRNWVSLQIVMMIFVLGILLSGQFLRAALETWFAWFSEWTSRLVTGQLWWSSLILLAGAILVLFALPLGAAYWLIPQPGPEEGEGGGGRERRWPPFAVLFLILVVAISYLLLPYLAMKTTCEWLQPEINSCQWINSVTGKWVAGLAITVCVLALIFWAVGRRSSDDKKSVGSGNAGKKELRTKLFRNTQARDRLSEALRTALAITLAVAAVALIDSFGQSLYVARLAGKLSPGKWLTALFGLIAAVAPFAKWIATMISGNGKGKRYSPPLKVLAAVGATVVILPVQIGLDVISYWIAFGGCFPPHVQSALVAQTPAAPLSRSFTVNSTSLCFKCDTTGVDNRAQSAKNNSPPVMMPDAPSRFLRLGLTLVGAVILSALFGITWPFINRSSLATIYTDRLTRAYLGASNKSRYGPKTGAVSEVVRGDDIPQGEYWESTEGHFSKGAPLHLVNVTINETLDADSQLQQQDRKGIGMAQGPAGVSAGVRHHVVFRQPTGAQRHADPDAQYRDVSIFPMDTEAFRMFDYAKDYDGQRVSLGKWIGISGAAVATGLGSLTSIGASLLTGFFNVRLGYWWDSGVNPTKTNRNSANRGNGKWTQWIGEKINRAFPVQTYLLDEFLARFHGSARQYWYLTDGGHFENLGAYELIRRRMRLIIIIDAAADPDYVFSDLANLIRKARLDFGAEISFLDQQSLDDYVSGTVRKFFGTLEQLRRGTWTKEPITDPIASGERLSVAIEEERLSLAHAALAKVRYDGKPDAKSLILLIKPTLTGDEPADVLRYHGANPSFPHQSTAEQFFDEAQWESYRKLGEHIAEQIFRITPASAQNASPDTRFHPGAMRWG